LRASGERCRHEPAYCLGMGFEVVADREWWGMCLKKLYGFVSGRRRSKVEGLDT